MTRLALTDRTIDDLTIEDERSFRHVALYASLKDVLRREAYRFRVLPRPAARWDRALLLNLTFWSANEGGDVLVDEVIPADVVAHAAWHFLAARALEEGAGAPLGASAMFLGEAIASAFDVYLIGRLLGHAPGSTFLETQIPAMADAASAAGLSGAAFEALLEGIAADPERAFEDLRQLLFDATTSLATCSSVDDAVVALSHLDEHRFAPILHHYELSNWVLHARAYGGRGDGDGDARVRAVDHALRRADVALDWLSSAWLDRTVPASVSPVLGLRGLRG